MKCYIRHNGVCASGANSCTRIWKGTMQLWFHSLTDGDSTLGLYTFKSKGGLHDSHTVGCTKLPQHCNLTPFSLNMGRKPSPFSVSIIQIYSQMCLCGVYSWQHDLLRYTDTAGRCIIQKKRNVLLLHGMKSWKLQGELQPHQTG